VLPSGLGFTILFWQFTRTGAVVTVITVCSQLLIYGHGISSSRADTPWHIGGRARKLVASQHREEERSLWDPDWSETLRPPADRGSAGTGSTSGYVRPDLAMGGDRCRRALAATLGR
jgi:hypothetical protein